MGVDVGVGIGCWGCVGRVAVGVEELDCKGTSGYGNSSDAAGFRGRDGCGGCLRLYFASWASINRLIFSHTSWSDGVAALGVAGVSVGLLPPGLVSGVTVHVRVGVVWCVGGRSSRGAVWGVEVVVGAGCFGVP